jgi:hypothetical protein
VGEAYFPPPQQGPPGRHPARRPAVAGAVCPPLRRSRRGVQELEDVGTPYVQILKEAQRYD